MQVNRIIFWLFMPVTCALLLRGLVIGILFYANQWGCQAYPDIGWMSVAMGVLVIGYVIMASSEYDEFLHLGIFNPGLFILMFYHADRLYFAEGRCDDLVWRIVFENTAYYFVIMIGAMGTKCVLR